MDVQVCLSFLFGFSNSHKLLVQVFDADEWDSYIQDVVGSTVVFSLLDFSWLLSHPILGFRFRFEEVENGYLWCRVFDFRRRFLFRFLFGCFLYFLFRQFCLLLLDFVFPFFFRCRFLLQLSRLHLNVHISLGGRRFHIIQRLLLFVLLNHSSRISRNWLLFLGLHDLRPVGLQQFVELYLGLQ